MNILNFTRLTGLLLVAGFFYSCGTSKSNLDELIQSNQYDRALNELNYLIEENPGDASLYLQRAKVNATIAQESEPEERLPYYNNTVDDFNFAEEVDASSKDLATIDSIRQQLWENEHNAGLQASENDSLVSSTRLAIAHFTNAVTLKPEAISSYKNLAVVQFNNGEIDGAIETLMNALNHLDNPPVSIYENLGYLYLEKGDPDEAIHYYELANKNIENDLNLAYGLVNAYIAASNSEKAVELLTELVEENPHNAKLRNVYGTQLYNLTASVLEELQVAYQAHDSALVAPLRMDAEAMGENAESQLIEAFKRDTLNTEYIQSLAVFYNNLSGQYFSLIDIAFNSHKEDLQQKALTLVDFAINYYSKLLEVDPNNQEYQSKMNSLRNLKQNRSELTN